MADAVRDVVLRGTVRLANGNSDAISQIHSEISILALLPDGQIAAEGRVTQDGNYSFLVPSAFVSTDLRLRALHALYVSRVDTKPISNLPALIAQPRSVRFVDLVLVRIEDRFVTEIKKIEQDLPAAIANHDLRSIANELLMLERNFIPAERSEEFRYRITNHIAETIHKIAADRLNTSIPAIWIDHLLGLSLEAWPSNLQLRYQVSLFALSGRALSGAGKMLERDEEFGKISAQGVSYLQSAIDNEWHRIRSGDAKTLSHQPYFDLIELASRKRQHATCIQAAQLFLDRVDLQHAVDGYEFRKWLLTTAGALSDCLAKETRRLSRSDEDYVTLMAAHPVWSIAWSRYGETLQKYAPYFVTGRADLSLQLERDLALSQRIRNRAE